MLSYNSSENKYEILYVSGQVIYEVYKVLCSGVEKLVEDGIKVSVNLGDSHTFLETKMDDKNVYKVVIKTVGEKDRIFFIHNDMRLLESIVLKLKRLFCEINSCNNCEKPDENERQTLVLSAYADMQIYLRNKYFPLSQYVNHVKHNLYCDDKNLLDCNTDKEFLVGDHSYSETLILRLLAFDYIALYMAVTDENLSDDTFPKTLIFDTLQSEEILCCIEDLLNISIKDFISKTMAKFTLNVTVPNLPPSVVGDYVLDVNTNNATYTLNADMFTTATTPAYVDPEGDAAEAVKFISLPTEGEIKLSGTPIVEGQEVLISDIDQNLLVYHTNQRLQSNTSISFNFAVSDVGSSEFTS